MTDLYRPDLIAVLRHYGVELPWTWSPRHWSKIRCPLPEHEDVGPSATFHEDAGKWHCFRCGSGDALDLIQAWERMTLVEAALHASEHFPPQSGAHLRDDVPGKRRSSVRRDQGDQSGGGGAFRTRRSRPAPWH